MKQGNEYETKWDETGKLIKETEELVTEHLQRIIQRGMLEPDSLNLLKKLRTRIDGCNITWQGRHFRVAIIGITKAGKSTFINALLGNDYLPRSTWPQTARVVRVRHKPEAVNGVLKEGEGNVVEGVEAIRTFIKHLNDEARTQKNQPMEDELVLEAPIVSLEGQPLGKYGFEILDTPGPTELGFEELEQKVEEWLALADVIICMLDITKLNSTGERAIFDGLHDVRQDLLREPNRLFFVVNMFDRQSDMTEEDTKTYVAEKVLNEGAGLPISKRRIWVTAGYKALLARLIETDRAMPEHVKDFVEKIWGESRNPESTTVEERKTYTSKMLADSRVPRFEGEVLRHFAEHGLEVLCQSLLSMLEFILIEFRTTYLNNWIDILEKDQNSLKDELAQREQQASALQNRLYQLKADINMCQKEAMDPIKEDLEDDLNDLRKSVKRKVSKKIDDYGKIRKTTKKKAKREVEELLDDIFEYVEERADNFRKKQKKQLEKCQKTIQELINELLQEIDPELVEELQPLLPSFQLQLSKISLKGKRTERKVRQLIRHKKEEKDKPVEPKQPRNFSEYEDDELGEVWESVVASSMGREFKDIYRIPPNRLEDTLVEEINEQMKLWRDKVLEGVDEQIRQFVDTVHDQLVGKIKISIAMLREGISLEQLNRDTKHLLLEETQTSLSRAEGLLGRVQLLSVMLRT